MLNPSDQPELTSSDQASSEQPTPESLDLGLGSIINGIEEDVLNHPWLRSHIYLILTILLCLGAAVYWRYFCEGKLAEVSRLEKKITDMRYRSLITKAALIEYERVGNIMQQIEEHQLQLLPATAPPYLLVDSGQYLSDVAPRTK